jgi:hypothetical protein
MSSTPLNGALRSLVTSEARLEIVRHLWPVQSPTTPFRNEPDWNAYFVFYTSQCNQALVEGGQHIYAKSHADLLRIARLLTTKPIGNEVKLEIFQQFTQIPSVPYQEAMILSAINLATRILAMINTGPLPNELTTRQLCIDWSHGALSNAVHDHFENEVNSGFEDKILRSDLTARNIDRVAKIKIEWTGNLLDHLRLVDDDKKLCVFHHASFLRHMEQIQRSDISPLFKTVILIGRCSPMYPDNFVKETLDTLTLLFPGDRKTKQWFDEKSSGNRVSVVLDLGLLHMGSESARDAPWRLENFHFWRKRLSALRNAIKDATPFHEEVLKTLRHRDRDRDEGDSWFNSWVAVVAIGLTLFFGLVQSVEGAVQVWKAYHPTAG